MQIFWDTGIDVCYESWPLVTCSNLLFVDRNERLEDRSIDSVIDQKNSASGLQPSIEFRQTRANAVTREKVEESGIVDAVEGGVWKFEVLGKLAPATNQFV